MRGTNWSYYSEVSASLMLESCRIKSHFCQQRPQFASCRQSREYFRGNAPVFRAVNLRGNLSASSDQSRPESCLCVCMCAVYKCVPISDISSYTDRCRDQDHNLRQKTSSLQHDAPLQTVGGNVFRSSPLVKVAIQICKTHYSQYK